MDWLIHLKSVAPSFLAVILVLSLYGKFSKFELFHHVENFATTQSSELAIFRELNKKFQGYTFSQIHTWCLRGCH